MLCRVGRTPYLLGASLLAIVSLPACPVVAQEPATRPSPTAPGQPSEAPQTPVPVIPEVLPNQPPPTVPSAPQRVLPPETVRVVPTATFQFEPSITLSEEYTDNFNLTERNKESNFRTTVAPGLRLLINTPLTRGVIAYTFSPAYDTAPDDFSLFHSLLGQVVWQANPRWTLTLADAFTRSDEAGQADRLALRQERRKFTSNTLSLSSDYLIGTVATRQSYQWSLFDNDDGAETSSHILAASATVPLYQVHLVTGGYEYLTSETSGGTDTTVTGFGGSSGNFDVTGHRLTASGSRRLNPVTLVGLRTSYAWRNVTSELRERDFQLWNAAVFSDYQLPGRLLLRGSVGVSGVMADSGETLGPLLSTLTSLTYQFGRAVATVAVDRGYSETFAEGENFGLVETEGITVSLTYPFTPTLSGTASGFFRHNEFTDVVSDSRAGLQNDRETESWGGTILFTYQMLRNLLLDLSYSYVRQEGFGGRSGVSDVGADNSYTENRVRASIRLNF